jgi:hypothetical protein
LQGIIGYAKVGKLVCVYAGSPERVLQLARALVRATKGFTGPAVPTDFHLGNVVYTRYGGYNPVQLIDADNNIDSFIYDTKNQLVKDEYIIPFVLPRQLAWPFKKIAPYKKKTTKRLLPGGYLAVTTLKSDAKGKVIKGFSFKKWLNIQHCVIKEGIANMCMDDSGRDIRDRLKWQYQLHQRLEGIIKLPKAIDYFNLDGNAYFVMEFIEGIPLSEVINGMYQGAHWVALDPAKKIARPEPAQFPGDRRQQHCFYRCGTGLRLYGRTSHAALCAGHGGLYFPGTNAGGNAYARTGYLRCGGTAGADFYQPFIKDFNGR